MNQIDELEQLLGARLPEDYKAFLLEGDPSSIRDKQYWMPHPDGAWIESIEWFNTGEQLLRAMAMETDLRRQGFPDYPNGTLPIAEDGVGDVLLLSYADHDHGAIYHFFHEEGDPDRREAGVYIIASSFDEWVAKLEHLSNDKDEEA